MAVCLPVSRENKIDRAGPGLVSLPALPRWQDEAGDVTRHTGSGQLGPSAPDTELEPLMF